MKRLNVSKTRVKQIEQQIAALKMEKEEIEGQATIETVGILAELKNSSYEVAGQGIFVKPSAQMRNFLPKAGSQDRFEIILDETLGYYLHIDDAYVTLSSDQRDDVAARLKWLAKQGVKQQTVSERKEGYGSVAYVEYELRKATEERDATVALIEKAFK